MIQSLQLQGTTYKSYKTRNRAKEIWEGHKETTGGNELKVEWVFIGWAVASPHWLKSFQVRWESPSSPCWTLPWSCVRIAPSFGLLTLFWFSSVQSLSHVILFVTPWTAAHQASLSITNSWSLLKLMSIESMMPSNHLILCHPLLLLPSTFPRIRVFSNESVLLTR